jgi:hypothetical protein
VNRAVLADGVFHLARLSWTDQCVDCVNGRLARFDGQERQKRRAAAYIWGSHKGSPVDIFGHEELDAVAISAKHCCAPGARPLGAPDLGAVEPQSPEAGFAGRPFS